MISIRNAVQELERYHQIRALAVSCYVSAIRNVADYAINFDSDITDPYRKNLMVVADTVSSGEQDVLEESRATVRALLREYRDKGSKYLNELREELADTARALEEMMADFSQSDGDHDQRIRSAVARLREISASREGLDLRKSILGAADIIEKSAAELRSQHQLTISQFQAEIRVLHRRIDALETAAAIDNLTQLLRRPEIEQRIASIRPESCIIMVKVTGLRVAGAHYDSQVAAELAAAFAKRLRNSMPKESVIGRWREEEFLAIVPCAKPEAVKLAKWIAEHLAGPYACLQGTKTVRPSLQLSVAIVDPENETPERVMQRVRDFLPER